MKKKVGVVCGGYSGESVISMKSADMIMKNIDRERFDVRQMVVTKERWYAMTDNGELEIDKNDFSFKENGISFKPDLCFIIIHGTPGEDGTLQGYFEMIGMPYTSGDVLNTSLTFHKISTTRLLSKMGFNVAKGIMLKDPSELNIEEVEKALSFPVFVKPNEGGSSLGISKVSSADGLMAAVELAFSKGAEVLIESYLDGRELTCGAIQTEGGGAMALAVTEIITQKEFFDFAAKYDYDQTQEITPADIPADLYKKCQETTVEIFKAFECRGCARVDYKLINGEFYAIEINTVPGMTDKSLVPQQAAEVGIGKKELISRIIDVTCGAA
jgi:D-alanine-D-alanine ligase